MSRIALCALFACSCNGSSAQPDASRVCPDPPLPYCSETCGNNSIDMCVLSVTPGETNNPCPSFFSETEGCDGTTIPACTARGYYGGTASCGSGCKFDARGCDRCANGPQLLDCENAGGILATTVLAGGGLRLALADSDFDKTKLAIYDVSAAGALTALPSVTIPREIDALVGVPGGWLAATRGAYSILQLDSDGATLAERMLFTSAPSSFPSIVYGVQGHALVVWDETVNSYQMDYAVLDATGQVVAAPRVLIPAGDSPGHPGAATDGTSFFVATLGKLTRIDGAGNVVATVAGFPGTPIPGGGQPPAVSWSGTTGWYVTPPTYLAVPVETDQYAAQQFDASGTPVGNPIAIDLGAPATSLTADGAELLGVRWTAAGFKDVYKLELVHIDASSTATGPIELGVADSNRITQLARVGADIAVSWESLAQGNVALAAPP